MNRQQYSGILRRILAAIGSGRVRAGIAVGITASLLAATVPTVAAGQQITETNGGGTAQTASQTIESATNTQSGNDATDDEFHNLTATNANITTTLTAYVVDDNGTSTRKTFSTADLAAGKATNLDSKQDMQLTVNGAFKDGQIVYSDGSATHYRLKWSYALGTPYRTMISDTKERKAIIAGSDGTDRIVPASSVPEGSTIKGYVQIVPDTTDANGNATDTANAVLNIEYDQAWAAQYNGNFAFNYSATMHWNTTATEDTKQQQWTLPGTSDPVTITFFTPTITGSKTCSYQTWVAPNYMGCTVTISLNGDVDDFVFTDTWDSGLNVSFANNGAVSMAPSNNPHAYITRYSVGGDKGDSRFHPEYITTDAEGRKFTISTPSLAKGEYIITYGATVNLATAQCGGDNKPCKNAKNTASWSSRESKPGTTTFTPNQQRQSSSVGWTEKKASRVVDADGNVTQDLEWHLYINYTYANLADVSNMMVVDDLNFRGASGEQAQHYYVGGLTVYKHTLTDGVDTSELIDNSITDLNAYATSSSKRSSAFQYRLPADAGKNKFEFVYHTRMRAGAVRYPNTATICSTRTPTSTDCSGEVHRSYNVDYYRDLSDVQLITKTAGNAEPITDANGKTVNTSTVQVPWTIVYDPAKLTSSSGDQGLAGAKVTGLEMYEDWVTSDTDGNTQHMWYLGDKLNLHVQECQSDDGDGGTCNDDGSGSGWKDVSTQYRITARDNNGTLDTGTTERQLPTSKEYGYDYPAGWWHKNGAESKDTYANHDGSPAFKLVYVGSNGTYDNGTSKNSRAFDRKLRITYTTLFDRTPDRYTNYAKFRYWVGYDINDTQYHAHDRTRVNETRQAYYTYTTNQVGKIMDAEHDGKGVGDKYPWSNAATWESPETIAVSIAKAWRTAGHGNNNYGADLERARAFVRKRYPDGRWVSHWRVWGNGRKSWWVAGFSGIEDMSGVNAITMRDSLPQGWHVADDKPVYGRFITGPENMTGDESKEYTTEGEARQEHWETFLLNAAGASGTGASGGDATPSAMDSGVTPSGCATRDSAIKQSALATTCGTWKEHDGKLTLTIPNDGSLTQWDRPYNTNKTAALADRNYDYAPLKALTDSDGTAKTIAVQGRAVVVFCFDTYITPEDAAKSGFTIGGSKECTNTADVLFDNVPITQTEASGTTVISQEDSGASSILNKTGCAMKNNGEDVASCASDNTTVDGEAVDSTRKNVKYTVEINPRNFALSAYGDTYTLEDSLDPRAEYNNDFRFTVLRGDGCTANECQLASSEHGFTSTISYDPQTHAQKVSFAIPKTVQAVGADGNEISVVNPHLRLTYTVRVKGVTGQEMDVSNAIMLRGTSVQPSESSTRYAITSMSASMSATGLTGTLRKTDLTGDANLSGAEFSIRQVDVSATRQALSGTTGPQQPSDVRFIDAGRWRCVVTGDTGTAKLSTLAVSGSSDRDAQGACNNNGKVEGLQANTLYALVETRAPTSYVLDDTPTYFVLWSSSASGYDDMVSFVASCGKGSGVVVDPSATNITVYDAPRDAMPASGGRLLPIVLVIGLVGGIAALILLLGDPHNRPKRE